MDAIEKKRKKTWSQISNCGRMSLWIKSSLHQSWCTLSSEHWALFNTASSHGNCTISHVLPMMMIGEINMCINSSTHSKWISRLWVANACREKKCKNVMKRKENDTTSAHCSPNIFFSFSLLNRLNARSHSRVQKIKSRRRSLLFALFFACKYTCCTIVSCGVFSYILAYLLCLLPV